MHLKKLTALAAAAVLSLTAARTPETALRNTAVAAERTVTFTQFDSSINGGEPIRGVDVSSIIAIEEAGVKFYNEQGREQDIFKTLSEHGVNYIRVRVWNEPNDGSGHTYGGGNNDVKVAGKIGKRASEYGMKLLVDIQYSDFWADPAKQTRPKYWQQHDHDTLKGEIYKWTHWVLESITAEGGDIGMVQVGNETNCFFCGEKDMTKICDLFASGNKAVRDFDKSILIAHHFANPNKTDYYLWYAKVMNDCRLDYDIFATSYYPYWHGTLDNLTSVLKTIGDTYGKHVMVAETAYPYTNEDGDTFGNTVTASSQGCVFSHEISVEGQKQSIMDVFQAVADTGKWGIGAFYWEPAWLGVPDISWEEQSRLWESCGSGWAASAASEYDRDAKSAGGSSYDNQALFDFHGKPLDSLNAFLSVYPQEEKIRLREGTDIPEGEYRIRNAETERYLTVSGGKAGESAGVVQYTADGAADYNTWRLKSDDDGYYRIYSAAGDKEYILDTDDSSGLILRSGNGDNGQRFKFVKEDSEGCLIVTKSTKDKFSLGVAGKERRDGLGVRQSGDKEDEAQLWVLEPVEPYSRTGDLNGDGEINAFDLVLLRRQTVSGEYTPSADINGDNAYGAEDLECFQKYILGQGGFEPKEKGTPRNTIIPE
jgi:arabinogalactan endo-1,4-beta-galactosidase